MKIGLYFGSFNPIHNGHLIIANHVLNTTDLQQVWFVVSPQNPLKKSSTLLNEYHRLHLIKSAIEGEKNLKASSIEFNLPKPSYTIDTLTHLKEKFPQHEFAIIMGSDSFANLEKWKNYQVLMNDYNIYIYLRPGSMVDSTQKNITILNAPLIEISSTRIRELIKVGKSIRYLVPDVVKEEIENNNYYR
jgi:nicotinate-nucleotide adenylyltransferase